MRYYNQYDADGWITAVVKTAQAPLNVAQIVSDKQLPRGIKKFDARTKEVIFYKRIYGEPVLVEQQPGKWESIRALLETIEDDSIARVTIEDVNILGVESGEET